MALAEATGAQLIPVDSEHSALHPADRQPSGPARSTGSCSPPAAGPFRGRTDLEGRHARGGARAPHLGHGRQDHDRLGHADEQGARADRGAPPVRLAYERIDVVVHPQSIVHSLVHLNDGASLAHLGYPDMRVPISYALHYPERADVPVRTLDLVRAAARSASRRRTRTPSPACAWRARPARAGGTAPVRAERRQRGGRARLPRRRAVVHRHRPGDRATLDELPARPVRPLRRPVLGRRRGPRARRGRGVAA